MKSLKEAQILKKEELEQVLGGVSGTDILLESENENIESVGPNCPTCNGLQCSLGCQPGCMTGCTLASAQTAR